MALLLLPLLLPLAALAARPPRSAVAVGSQVGGRHELLELQGERPWTERFDFGEAWRATDRQSGKVVVIKPFRGKGADYVRGGDSWQQADWWREKAEGECFIAQRVLAGNSSYPEGRKHICGCLEAHIRDVKEGEVAYLVEQDCGDSMAHRVEEGPAFSRAEARRWMAELLKGLAFMAGLETPVAHMDLGLRNAAVGKDGTARLIDFGVAVEGAGAEASGRPDLLDWALAYRDLLAASKPRGPMEAADMAVYELARGRQASPLEVLRRMPSGAMARTLLLPLLLPLALAASGTH